MKPNQKLFLFVLTSLFVIGGYIYVFPYFVSSNKDLEKIPSEVSLNSSDLVASFITNEEKSNKLYTGKIVEITGFVKEVTFLNDTHTVILYTKSQKQGVICDLHKSQIGKIKKLKKHQKISVKGICKGFLKDVVLLNCYLDLKPNE